MTLVPVTETFSPTDSGGYDIAGTYFPSSTAVVTNAVEVENVFYTFSNDALIYAAGLMSSTFYFSYTLSNFDYLQNQPIYVASDQFQSASDQTAIESNKTNPGNTVVLGESGLEGTGNETVVAGNYGILNLGGGETTTNIRGGSVSDSFNIPASEFPNSPYDLYVTFQAGDYPSDTGISSGYAGLTKVSNVQLTVIGLTYINLPIITGTVANQPVLDDLIIAPFTNVTLSDPSNPGGFGDIMAITIEGQSGTADGTLGTLTLRDYPANTLLNRGNGVYLLQGISTSTLQAEVQALLFTPTSLSNAPSEQVTLALSYASLGGGAGTTTDVSTTIAVSHDQRTITLAGRAMGDDRKPFRALSGFAVVDPYANDQVGATIRVQTGTGTLSGTGLVTNADGSYSLAATTVSQLNTELAQVLFTATPGLVAVGSTSTAEISLIADAGDGWVGQSAESVLVTAVAGVPTITGSQAIRVTSEQATRPFAAAGLTDDNYNDSDTLKITLSNRGAGGVLSGPGLTSNGPGTYTLTGTAAQVAAALQGLQFKPTAGAPGSITTTTFTLEDRTSVGTSATSSAFSVTNTDRNVVPTLAGGASSTVQSEAASTPFTGVTLTDLNVGSTDTLTIRQSLGAPGGVLSGAGLVAGGGGAYSLSGTAAQVTAALQALVFTPTAGTPGTSSSVSFSLKDIAVSGLGSNTITLSVTNVDPAVAPTLTGGAALTVQNEAVSNPFATAVLTDPNGNSTDALTIQLSGGGAGGALAGAGLSGGANGSYTLSGTAAQVTAALQALVFTPVAGASNSSTTTTFTLTDTTTPGTVVSTSGFSVTDTDPVGTAGTLSATGAVYNPGTVNNTTIDATSAGSHTVLAGAGSRNLVRFAGGNGTVSGSGTGDAIVGGNGVISVSGLGGGTSVTLGDGNDTVNLATAGAYNVVVTGNGNSHIVAGNGGHEMVTVGNGVNVISAGGAGDVIVTGNGGDTVTVTGAGASVTTGSGNDAITVVGVGGATIRAGLGLNKIAFAGTGNVIINQGGTDTLTDSGSGNTIVLPPAGSGMVTIGSNALGNGDVFDLRAAMAATAWDHVAGDIGSYLSVVGLGADAAVVIDPSGASGGPASVVAVITGASSLNLAGFLPHTLT